MSSFRCEVCGVDCIDTPRGYVTGCEHYPLFKKEDEMVAKANPIDGDALDKHAEEYAERFINEQLPWLEDALIGFRMQASIDSELLRPDDAFGFGLFCGIRLSFMNIAIGLANGEIKEGHLARCAKS